MPDTSISIGPWIVIAAVALIAGTAILASVGLSGLSGLWWHAFGARCVAWRSRAAWLASLGVPTVLVSVIVLGIFSRQNMLPPVLEPGTNPVGGPHRITEVRNSNVRSSDFRLGARPQRVESEHEFAERVTFWANRRASGGLLPKGTEGDPLTRPDVTPRADRLRWAQIVEIAPRPRTSANDPHVKIVELESQWFATLDECEQRLTDRLTAAVLAVFSTAFPDVSPTIALPPELLLRAAREGSLETEEKDFGNGIKAPMYRLHLTVGLDPDLMRSVFQVYRRDVVSHRIWVLGGVTAWVVSLLATFSIVAHLNRRTEGKHLGKLIPAGALAMSGGMLLLATVYM